MHKYIKGHLQHVMFDDYIHGNADRVHFYCLLTYKVMLTQSLLLLVEIMCV